MQTFSWKSQIRRLTEVKMDDNEKYVRSKWIEVGIQRGKIEGVRYGMAHSNGRGIPLHGFATEEEIWSASRVFTEARLKAIAEVEEEVTMTESYISGQRKALDIPYELPTPKETFVRHIAIFQRILSREQSVLAALKSGMREE
jgi:hypothetical protein